MVQNFAPLQNLKMCCQPLKGLFGNCSQKLLDKEVDFATFRFCGLKGRQKNSNRLQGWFQLWFRFLSFQNMGAQF